MKGMIVVIFGLVALFVAFCIAIVACSSEASPQPISQMDAYRLPAAAYRSPSIDQQILDADVIVIASLVSATADVQTIPSKPGVAPTYRPMQTLSFRANEYLKGTGPAEFTVEVLDDSLGIHTHGDLYEGYLTEAEARTAAEELVSQRNTTWDNRPAIIFLEGPLTSASPSAQSGQVYGFTLSNQGAQTNFEYSVDTLSRTWLPAKNAVSSEASVASTTEYITDGTTNPPPVTTISALKTRIGDIDVLLNAGDGSEDYNRCVYDSLVSERYFRDTIPVTIEYNIASGMPSESAISQAMEVYDPKYNLFFVSGTNADYFAIVVRDSDSDASNGYYFDYVTTRPLPKGEYSVNFHERMYYDAICDFNPMKYNYIGSTITVTALEGTLHEAFFDPVESVEDEVSPASFSVGGTDTEITGLDWADGNVTLSLDPVVSLDGYTLDFIELDGMASLNLRGSDVVERSRAGDGSGTLKWAVADEPWEDGDKLMLRIREDGAAAPPAPGTGE